MSTKQMLADVILEPEGGLYEWAMKQRRGVQPKPWDQVAEDLGHATDGRVETTGRQLRQWLIELERSGSAGSGAMR